MKKNKRGKKKNKKKKKKRKKCQHYTTLAVKQATRILKPVCLLISDNRLFFKVTIVFLNNRTMAPHRKNKQMPDNKYCTTYDQKDMDSAIAEYRR